MADVYFAVGTSTSDFKVASTVTVSGSTATFSAGQTGNIGVGCVIDYDSDNKKAYIKSKTSDTVWEVTNATGGNPTAASEVTVNSIKRVFNKLETALHGTGTTGNIRALVGNFDLTAISLRILVVCYADGSDDSLCTIQNNWVTSSSYYIFVFTPKTSIDNTSPGVANTNQRHNGIRSGSGYIIQSTVNTAGRGNIIVKANFTKVFGIKVIRTTSNWDSGVGIGWNYSTTDSDHTYPNDTEIAYNFIIEEGDGTYYYGKGICINMAHPNGHRNKVHDNFICSVAAGTTETIGLEILGEYQNESTKQSWIYNNVVYGYYTAAISLNVTQNDGSGNYLPYFRNNYGANILSTNPDYTFAGNYTNSLTIFDYNRSDDTTAGTSNHNNQCTIANASFLSTTLASLNLHINTGSSLVNAGIGPTGDSNVPTLDIDGHTRSGATCDIGADEIPVLGARLIGDSALVGDSLLVGNSALVN